MACYVQPPALQDISVNSPSNHLKPTQIHLISLKNVGERLLENKQKITGTLVKTFAKNYKKISRKLAKTTTATKNNMIELYYYYNCVFKSR